MPNSQYQAGQIFRLPPASTDLDDWDSHFHALLAVHPEDATATLVYASTSGTDSRCGAPSLLIHPNSQNGLTESTHFYGAVVVVVPRARLGSARGNIYPRINELRGVVREAMGYRKGPAYNVPRGTQSVRGRIAELTDRYAELYGTRYCAILTKHEYSVRKRHQMLAPLYDSAPDVVTVPFASAAMPAPLHDLFASEAESIYAHSDLVRCLWEEKAIRRLTDRTLDEPFLSVIEDAVCARWAV